MVKEPISARLATSTVENLEEYAERKDISKSEAINRLLDQSLEIENNEASVVIADGGGHIEEKINSTENEIQQTQDTVNQLKTEIEKLRQETKEDVTQNGLSWVMLGIGLAFLILYISLSIPSIVSVNVASIIVSGIVLDNIGAI
jgi:Ribbon-helix-helix protein, copG family.